MPEAIAYSGSHFHSAAVQGLIEVVIGSPFPRPQAPSGATPSVPGVRLPILSHLPAFACPGLPLQLLTGWGKGSGCLFLGCEVGEDLKPQCQGAREKPSPAPSKAHLVLRYYEQ